MEQTQYPAYHSLLLTSVLYALLLALATFANNAFPTRIE